MAELADKTLPEGGNKYSKDNPWYYENLAGHLALESRKLLEEYSHIPPEDVEAHVYKLVHRLLYPTPHPFQYQLTLVARYPLELRSLSLRWRI